MKHLLALTMIILLALGCDGFSLTTPDGGDMARLEQQIAGIPSSALLELKVWAANRYTAGYLHGQANGNRWKKIGTIYCPGAAGKDVHLHEALDCLNSFQTLTYAACLTRILNAHQDSPDGATTGEPCHWHDVFTPGYAPDELPGECEPESVDAERIVLALLGPPPPLEIQMLFFGAGLFGASGALCPLAAWGCPDDPGAPGVPQPAPGPGDGDHR
jgi:hypothetical protein